MRRLVRIVAVALSLTLGAAFSVGAQVPPASNSDVLDMLMHNRYDALDMFLSELQHKFEADPEGESPLRDAFRAIEQPPARTERDMDGALDNWVARFPRSYVALTARGRYRLHRGLEARGSKFVAETSRHQIEEMKRHFAMAREDLQRSLALTRKPLLSHLGLYAMAMRTREDGDGEAYYTAAVAYAPRSEALRELRMESLRPRWHGSLNQMEAYARETESEIGPGTTTDRMYNIIVEERAWAYERREDWAGAIAVYAEGLAKRDSRRLVCGRASAHARLEHWGEAIADLTLALKRPGPHDYCAELAAWVAQRRIDDPAIPALLQAYIENNPRHGGLRQARAWLLHKSGRHAAAYDDLRFAADAGHAWSQMMVARYLLQGTGDVKIDRARAIEWLRAAADQGQTDARELLIATLRDGSQLEEAQMERRHMRALARERPFNKADAQIHSSSRAMGSLLDDQRLQAVALGVAFVAFFVVRSRARRRSRA